jgi:hypothetical protein
MILSSTNAKALLFDLNQDIEEYAADTVRRIIELEKFDELTFPPNGGLTSAERVELSRLDKNENLKNALRKILADNTAGVISNMLNLFDGTGSPKHYYEAWTGVKLVDEEPGIESNPFEDTLHDGLYETYWEWRKVRENSSWKLDLLDD